MKNSAIYQKGAFGKEAAYGVAVQTGSVPQGLSFMIDHQAEFTKHRPDGMKFSTENYPHKMWTSVGFEGLPSYIEMAYLLASAFADATPSGGASPYTWVFDIDSDGPDTPATYTVMKGADGDIRQRVTGAVVDSLSMEFGANSGLKVSGTMLSRKALLNIVAEMLLKISGDPTGGTFVITYGGVDTAALAYNATAADVQAALLAHTSIAAAGLGVECSGGTMPSEDDPIVIVITDNAGVLLAASDFSTTDSLSGGTTPASSITDVSKIEIANVGIRKQHINVYLADTMAGLDVAVALTNLTSTNWALGSRYQAFYALNRAYGLGHADVVEGEPSLTGAIKMEANATNIALADTMEAGTTKFLRIEAVGAEISGGVYYTLELDFAVKFNAPLKHSDEDGVYAVEFGWEATHDPTSGRAARATLINSLAAL